METMRPMRSFGNIVPVCRDQFGPRTNQIMLQLAATVFLTMETERLIGLGRGYDASITCTEAAIAMQTFVNVVSRTRQDVPPPSVC